MDLNPPPPYLEHEAVYPPVQGISPAWSTHTFIPHEGPIPLLPVQGSSLLIRAVCLFFLI